MENRIKQSAYFFFWNLVYLSAIETFICHIEIAFNRVYLFQFCTKYDTWFSICSIKNIVALSSINVTKRYARRKTGLFTKRQNFWFDQIESVYRRQNIIQKFLVVFDRAENTVGTGENVGYRHFLIFLQSDQNTSSAGSWKPGLV